MSLFESRPPLAERARPNSLDEIFGHENIIGKNSALYKNLQKGLVQSFILWGPPGCGKTTIARVIACHLNADFYEINAVSSGVKDIKEIIDRSKNNFSIGQKTILFIDEIHRFNKAQQDALLAAVEKGWIILIGATTENPSFEIIPPLRSRTKIYKMEELKLEDLKKIIERALRNDEILKTKNIRYIDIEHLYLISGGDARISLNIIEEAINLSSESDEISIDKNLIDSLAQRTNISYDKGGEEHYNIISAFIKSVRGSDPDAAIYWLARMLEGGEDPLFIARRMIILAAEDIGLASPNALLIANATFDAVHKIGMPEARIPLAECAIYLSLCPKSNSAYLAINNALEYVKAGNVFPVPLHLRNALTNLMKQFGYASGYKYPHDFPDAFVNLDYLPKEASNIKFYVPKLYGQEKSLYEKYYEIIKKYQK